MLMIFMMELKTRVCVLATRAYEFPTFFVVGARIDIILIMNSDMYVNEISGVRNVCKYVKSCFFSGIFIKLCLLLSIA